MNLDDQYIVKCLNAGKGFDFIGTKLNISPTEVVKRWERIQKEAKAMMSNGFYALSDQFSVLCNQYELQGASLKIIAMALSNVMPEKEIRKLVDKDPEKTIQNFFQNAIILRPFTPVNPEEIVKQDIKSN